MCSNGCEDRITQGLPAPTRGMARQKGSEPKWIEVPEFDSPGGVIEPGQDYHDLGKMRTPRYFAENQGGANPHDKLKPSILLLVEHLVLLALTV